MPAREHYQLPSTRVSNSWCICCGWQIEATLSLVNALDIFLERPVCSRGEWGNKGISFIARQCSTELTRTVADCRITAAPYFKVFLARSLWNTNSTIVSGLWVHNNLTLLAISKSQSIK